MDQSERREPSQRSAVRAVAVRAVAVRRGAASGLADHLSRKRTSTKAWEIWEGI
jgi:hypothetical protein